MNSDTFKILSIDGGGIRGVFPAHILSCISTRLNINVTDYFDMIAGTSTGSIVAAAIALKKEPKEIVSLYKEQGSKIFPKGKSCLPTCLKLRLNFLRQLKKSTYEIEPLDNALKNVIGDVKLGDISIPLLIPATDIGHGGVHVFKSSYSADFTRDKNVLLRKAILASCSAPIYFDPTKVNEYLLSDGGLWANNPSLAAIIDAQRRLNIDLSNIKILSLGTGHARQSYGVNTERNWGFLNGWKGKEFINFLMSLQAQSINNYVQLMLQKNQFIRIDFDSDLPLPLDDYDSIDDLISRADRVFTYSSSEIKAFLNN